MTKVTASMIKMGKYELPSISKLITNYELKQNIYIYINAKKIYTSVYEA